MSDTGIPPESMDERRRSIESTQELIRRLTLDAIHLEQLAEKSKEPERSHYTAKAGGLREAAYIEETKLRKLERARAANGEGP